MRSFPRSSKSSRGRTISGTTARSSGRQYCTRPMRCSNAGSMICRFVLYSFDPQCERNLLGLAQAAKQVAGMAANVNLSDPDQIQRQTTRESEAKKWEVEAPAEPSTKFLPIAAGLNILNVNEVPTATSPRAKLQAELAAPIRYEVPLALTAMVPMIATTLLVRRLHLPTANSQTATSRSLWNVPPARRDSTRAILATRSAGRLATRVISWSYAWLCQA